MNIVKCANGHFFDSENYKLCPHCGAPVGAAPTPAAVPPTPPPKKTSKRGLFGTIGKKAKEPQSVQPVWGAPPQGGYQPQGPGGYYNPGGFSENSDQVTGGNTPSYMPGSTPSYMPNNGPRTEDVPVHFDQPDPGRRVNSLDFGSTQSASGSAPITGGKTLDFWDTKQPEPDPSLVGQNNNPHNPEYVSVDRVPEWLTSVAADAAQPHDPAPQVPQTPPVPQTPQVPQTPPVQQTPQTPPTQSAGSLLNQVRQASNSDEGKTLSYFSAVTGAAAATTAPAPGGSPAAPAAPKPIDPVVGWLVSVEGPHFGESFAIHSGTNSIGRNGTNRIVLERDLAVSREKHAFITYEPKHRQFYVKPGDSSGLVYVNDKYITDNQQLKTREVLEIGSSKLVFVPFCTEEFGWEDVLNK